MEHRLRYQLLNSFQGTDFIHIIREYGTGKTGADVFAARFRRKEGEKDGLEGIYVIKIDEKKNIDAERSFYEEPSTKSFARLLAPLRDVTEPIDGVVAAAYDVAFHDFSSSYSLASILTRQSPLTVEEVKQQIECLVKSFVDWHIAIDVLYKTGTDNYNSNINTFYHLLALMLNDRLSDIKSRLEACLPDWRQDTPQIKFMERIIINPLRYVQEDIWDKFKQKALYDPDYYTAPIHGDAHAENIICHAQRAEGMIKTDASDPGSTGKEVALDPPKLIDFGQTRKNGIPLFDLMYMEFDIMRRTLRVDSEESCEQWLYLLDHTMESILPGDKIASGMKWDTKDKTLAFIYPIRQQVKRWLDVIKEKDQQLGDSLECVWWLSIVAVGLNFARKGDSKERPQAERKAALLYAAYGLKGLHRKLRVPEVQMDEPPFVSWTGLPSESFALARFLQTLKERERDELDMAPLHTDENKIDYINKCPLTKVFVCPDVIAGRPYDDTLPSQANTGQINKKTGNGEKEQNKAEPEPLLEVLEKKPYLLLFGHVGTGKSMILRYLELQIVHNQAELSRQFPQLAGLVPVHIELEHYAQAVEKNAGKVFTIDKPHPRLQEFISSYLQSYYQEDKYFIEQQIKDGRVLFLFSGLDAIADKTIQEKVAREIKDYTIDNKKNRFVVTCRPIDFKVTHLFYTDYASYALMGLTEKQIQQYLTQWCQIHYKQEEQAQAEVARLLQVIHNDRAIQQMVTNPLFLAIFALEQSMSQDAPFSRNGYFEHCLMLLFYRKNRKKDSDNQHAEEKVLEVIDIIAYLIYEQQIFGKAVSRDSLIKQIELLITEEGKLEDEEKQSKEVKQQIEGCIDLLRKKMGILLALPQERYDFLFTPLKEYLAARYIARKDRIRGYSKQEFIARCRERYYRRHWNSRERRDNGESWEEVFRHMYGIIISKKETKDDIERAIRVLLDKDAPYHDLLFAAQYLIDNPLDPDTELYAPLEEEVILKIVLQYLENKISDTLRSRFSRFLSTRSKTLLVGKLKSILEQGLVNKQEPSIDFMDRNSNYRVLVHRSLQLIQTSTATEKDDNIRRLRMMTLLSLLGIECPDCNSDNWGIMTIRQIEQTSDVDIKQAAIMSLGMFGQRDWNIHVYLLEALRAPEWQVRAAAAQALSFLSKEIPEAFILAQVFRRLQATVCTDKEKEELINIFTLTYSNVSLPENAYKLMAEVTDYLISIFPMVPASIQRATVEAMGELAQHQASEATREEKIQALLLSALISEEPAVRAASANAVGKTGWKERSKQDRQKMIEALQRALFDSSELVRGEAKQALEHFEKRLLPPEDLLFS